MSYESNFLLNCKSSTTSHVIFSMPSNSISGIPNGAGLSSGTTKNLHLAILFLCLNLTEQTPSSVFELLYVFNTTALFLWQMKLLLLT